MSRRKKNIDASAAAVAVVGFVVVVVLVESDENVKLEGINCAAEMSAT